MSYQHKHIEASHMLIVPMHCTLILDSVEHSVVLFKPYWQACEADVFACLEADGWYVPVRFAEL